MLPGKGDFRRWCLLLSCLAYLGIGLSYVISEPGASRRAGFSWLPIGLGVETIGWLWIVVATAVTVASLLRPTSKAVERWCYALLTIPPTGWAAVFLMSWLLGAHPLGYASAISYAYITGLVLTTAAWPNPPGGARGERERRE